MPLDPIISRGVAPVDVTNTLYTIARMNVADREERRRSRTNDLLERRFESQEKQAGELEERKQALAKVQWALRSPSPAKAILDDPEAVMAFTQQGMDLVGLDDARAKQMLEYAQGQMAAQLGMGPPEPKDPGPLVEAIKDGRPTLLPRDQAVGLRPYDRPQQFAPQRPEAAPADQRFAEWYMGLPPEKQRQVDQALAAQRSSGGATRPQVLQDPWGGDPTEIISGPDGRTLRRPIPLEGGTGPTVDRAQALTEARAAVATGRITKEQAAERLRGAGIDPTGL